MGINISIAVLVIGLAGVMKNRNGMGNKQTVPYRTILTDMHETDVEASQSLLTPIYVIINSQTLYSQNC